MLKCGNTAAAPKDIKGNFTVDQPSFDSKLSVKGLIPSFLFEDREIPRKLLNSQVSLI